MTQCDVCTQEAEPENLPDEPQYITDAKTGETKLGYDPRKENLCGECYQDKYWIKGEDY